MDEDELVSMIGPVEELNQMSDSIDQDINKLDQYSDNIDNLYDVSSALSKDSLSTESFKVVSVSVEAMYKKLGIDVKFISLESNEGIFRTALNKIEEFIKYIVNKIKELFNKLKEFIKNIFNKKADKTKKEVNDVEKTGNQECKIIKEININDPENGKLVKTFISDNNLYPDTNEITSKMYEDYYELIKALINKITSEESELANLDSIKDLSFLNEYVNKNLPFGKILVKEEENDKVSYKIIHRPTEDFKEINKIEITNSDHVKELMDKVKELNSNTEKLNKISSMISNSGKNYIHRYSKEPGFKKIDRDKEKKYTVAIYVVYGLAANLVKLISLYNKEVLKYGDLCIKVWETK